MEEKANRMYLLDNFANAYVVGQEGTIEGNWLPWSMDKELLFGRQ